MRLSLDINLLTAFEPFVKIQSSTSQDDLKLSHRTIVPDFDENDFIAEYYTAAQLLNNREFGSVLETLHRIIDISPDELRSIKVALARIAVAKPHSADVERLISKHS